ncbi:MAG TPA: GFA family protein [Caulobacteraceae bacterium]
MTALTGGCQCGAVRFSVSGELGRASICHCRMCQKAFGAFYGPLVSAPGVAWTRGAPAHFQSSNRARRGFCPACGTPLTFEPDDGPVELAIGAFDDPAAVRPVIQHALESRIPWLSETDTLPIRTPSEAAKVEPYYASIVSRQHPDHDT